MDFYKQWGSASCCLWQSLVPVKIKPQQLFWMRGSLSNVRNSTARVVVHIFVDTFSSASDDPGCTIKINWLCTQRCWSNQWTYWERVLSRKSNFVLETQETVLKRTQLNCLTLFSTVSAWQSSWWWAFCQLKLSVVLSYLAPPGGFDLN